MRNKFKQLLTLALFASTCQIASAHDFEVDGIVEMGPATNVITYTSTDGQIVTPYNENAFGANIISNTYENGVGTITFDGDVTSIGDNAFNGCSTLASIGDLPACISIGSSAFEGCSSLMSVGDLSACTTIGEQAFRECGSLTSFTIPSNVIDIKHLAFNGCSGIKTLIIEDGETELKLGYGSKSQSGLSSTVGLFDSCPLERVYLGRNLSVPSSFNSKIGPFRRQSQLAIVDISKSVTHIDDDSFSYCSSLTDVDLSACTSIGSSAFADCSSLTSVDLSACTSIGSSAFAGCSSLTSVDLSACTSIGSSAFAGCSALMRVEDLSACTSIGNQVFYCCSALTSIGDLSACTSIGSQVFYGCNSLYRVVLSTSEVSTLSSSNAFGSITTVLVPNNLLADYKTADNWKSLSSRIIAIGSEPDVEQYVSIQENTSGLHAAIGEENLASVIELKVIGDINSYDIGIIRDKMPNLHVLDLSESRIRTNTYKYYNNSSSSDDILGDYAFYNMQKLVTVILPNNITEIGYRAFYGCTYLKQINIPKNTTYIHYEAFSQCANLQSILFTSDSKLTTIGTYAFYNCQNIKSLYLPSSVSSIEKDAFGQCIQLQSIHFASDSNLKTIGDGAFAGCPQITTISIPNSVSKIGASAFWGCAGLTELYLPTSLKSVGNKAFGGCANLNEVYALAPNAYAVAIQDESFATATREQGTLFVPYDKDTDWRVTYDTYYWQTQWKRFLNIKTWLPKYDRFPIDSDYDQETGTIPGEEIDANFGTNAGYILGEEAYQHFKTVVLKCNASKGGSIIVKGNKNISIGELFPEIEVSGNKWYFFCFPFDIKLSDVTCGVDGRFVFRKYDSAARADGGTGWTNLAADEEWLKAGVGYIFQCNKAGTLRLPILDPQFADADKSPELEAHPAANDQDASWNFVGNPYLSYYQLEDLGFDAPVTYWNGTSYVAVRPGDDDYVFQPYQAFFVQKPTDTQTVGFDGANQQTYTQSQNALAHARERRARQRINPDRLIINVTLSDGENTDQTRVVYNNETSASYEMACDASKFMSTEAVPQLFSVGGDVQYAINERPHGEVSLGYKVSKAGTYTISMTRMDAPMLLKDLKTGVTFDFTIGEDYVFEAEAGTCTNRFVLLLNPNTNRIENMTIADAENAQFYNLAGQRTDGDSDAIQIMKQGESAKKVMIK